MIARFVLAALLFALTPLASAQERRMAVTFDDLPAAGVADVLCNPAAADAFTRRLLDAIAAEQMPAAGFVNEGRVCERHRARILNDTLGQWADAGHTLGNHTFTHLDLNRTPIAAYLEDIVGGEDVTRAVLEARGRSLIYFRHPQLHTGADIGTRDAVAQFLTARGYRVAPVTIDNQEWVFAAAYARALARNDRATADRVLAAYTPYMEDVTAFFEQRSRETLGREPAQVLLLHANDLNVAALPTLAAMLRARGYSFVTLDEAMTDEAYALADGYVGSRGLSWIHRWGLARGLAVAEEPREPQWIAEAAQQP